MRLEDLLEGFPPLSKGSWTHKATSLFIIALIFRLALLVIPADRKVDDQAEYLALADNLRTHAVFGYGDVRETRRAPLYPMILAGLGPGGTQVLQMIAGSAIVPLTFAIASSLLPPFAAMIVGLAMAFAPMSSRYCTLFMTETLFTFLLMAGSLFWMKGRPVLCGICFGLAALTRAVLLPLLVLLPLFGLKRAWRSAVIISLTALAIVTPWTIRNATVLHRLVPVATGGWGSNLFQGTLDVPEGDPWPFIMQARAGDSEDILLKRAVARIREDPGRWLLVRAKQYPKLYLVNGGSIGSWAKPLLWGGNIALLLLAMLGWWRLRPGPYVWVYPAFTAVSQLPMWTESRYSLPMVPFLLVLACGSFSVQKATAPGLRGRDG